MKRRQGEKDGVARIRESFARAGRPAAGGRIDFLFDERKIAPVAASETQPWESPPPAHFRGDAAEEAFVSAGLRSPESRFAVTLAMPLEPLRALAEAAAIVFYGVIARVAGAFVS